MKQDVMRSIRLVRRSAPEESNAIASVVPTLEWGGWFPTCRHRGGRFGRVRGRDCSDGDGTGALRRNPCEFTPCAGAGTLSLSPAYTAAAVRCSIALFPTPRMR